MKAEASGYPPGVETEEQKNTYVDSFHEREGVRLDKESILNNPGLRSLAKLCLNSFWGKFGQRNNLDQVEYYTQIDELNATIYDETKDIVGMCFVSDEVAQVQWRFVEDFVTSSPNTNPFIAAYTTAHARLKLYSYLEQLGDRVLYFDTDSVIYVTRPGETELPIGEFMGELTDELSEFGPNATISEFVAAGPKNYSYKVTDIDGNVIGGCCKVKGLTLNAHNSSLVNFEKMKELVMNKALKDIEGEAVPESDQCVVLSEKRITRTKDHTVVTQTQQKTWRVVYDKRQIQPDLSTLPWGYK